jgi:NADH:ubiquinone reductase (H+-translocating)
MRSIVILGAGFGGVSAAKIIGRALGNDPGVRITVIDRQPLHLFTPLLYELATVFMEHANIGTANLIRSGITADATSLLARWGVDFLQADVVGGDLASRHVHLSTGISLRYDTLIVAVGSETNYFNIPGMQERALPLKTAPDAERLRRRVHEFLHQREKGKIQRFTVAIGGAGAAGVELASELTMLLRQHLMKGHLQPGDFTISLIEGRDRVLGMMDLKVSAIALDRLQHLGVSVYLDAVVKQVHDGKLVLAPRPLQPNEVAASLKTDFRGKETIEVDADVLVWTGGVKGNPVLEKLGLPIEGRGKRVPVGPSLEVEGHPDVFVVGDAALLMDPATKLPVPWLAQAAVEHGRVVGETVVNRIGSKPDAAYRFRTYPMIITVGGKFAIVQMRKAVCNGTLGWFLRGAADLRYFLGILSPFRALRVWWSGVRIYTQND